VKACPTKDAETKGKVEACNGLR